MRNQPGYDAMRYLIVINVSVCAFMSMYVDIDVRI